MLADIEASTLVNLADRLVQLREERIQEAIETHKKVLEDYTHARLQESIAAEPPDRIAQAQAGELRQVESTVGTKAPKANPISGTVSRTKLTVPKQAKRMAGAMRDSLSLQALADWAIEMGADPAEVKSMTSLARASSYDPQILKASDYQMALEKQLDHMANVAVAFRN